MGNADEVVLVVSTADDDTATAVETELHARSCTVVRFDLGEFPSSVRLAARSNGASWSGDLHVKSQRIELESVKSVYYRRPGRFALPPELSPGDAAFATTEAKLGFGGVLTSLPALWVNHPAKVAIAEYKSAQLTAAAIAGMSVPRTLVTNDIEALRAFATDIDGPLICKTFSSLMLTDGDVPQTVFTTLVDPSTVDARQLNVTSHLFQEWVPKIFEARITVVGSNVFAAAIHANSDPARVDWRADYPSLRYERIDPPPEIVEGIRKYMLRFELNFGAFDFVIEPDRSWRFLECNSNGQWLWIEHEVGLPIASALAELLDNGKADRPWR